MSQKTGVSLRSLRYYEEKGLLNPKRLSNGYREYTETDIELTRTIQFYLGLGITTEEIAKFIDCLLDKGHEYLCTREALDFYEEKYKEVRNQMEALKKAESEIKDRIMSWREIERHTRERK